MTSHDDLVAAFDRWVLDPHRGPLMDVAVHLRRGGESSDRWRVEDVLYELADDGQPVDAHVQAALQLPVEATYGLAARMLWATRHVWGGLEARTVG